MATYYITTSGNNGNSGLSEVAAWRTIQYGFNQAQAGDTVYIKAGNYGNEAITSVRGGTSENPIRFIGYQTTPGDINAINGPTFDFDDWKNNGEELNTSLMPFMNNNKDIPLNGEHAFELEHPFIELHNIMMAKYRIGVNLDANDLTLNNIIGDQFGVWDPNAFCWNAIDDGCTDPVDPSYHRQGWAINSAGNPLRPVIKNCLFIDAGMVCYFMIGADNFLIENCQGISYNTGNGSDYLFDMYRCDNGIMRNCYAYRFEDPNNGHRSRGFIFQGNCNNNLVEDFISENVRCQVTHSRNNTFRNVKIFAGPTATGNENDGALQIASGANDNLFYNFEIYDCGGVQFLGYENPLNLSYSFTTAAENCYFVNFKISNIRSQGSGVISFHRLSSNTTMTAGTNYAIGWTVDNFEWLINANRGGTMHFYNSTFSNGNNSSFDTRVTGGSWGDGLNDYILTFTNCNWAPSNTASIPIGSQWTQTNVINIDPQLTNASNKDFTLQSGSGLIDAGMNASTILASANIDFDNNARPGGTSYDIGAYEFNSQSGESNKIYKRNQQPLFINS